MNHNDVLLCALSLFACDLHVTWRISQYGTIPIYWCIHIKQLTNDYLISAPTLNTFKNRLEQFWDKTNVKYDFEASLKLIYQTGTIDDLDAIIEV